VTATNGHHAVEKAQKKHFDLIIMDLNMPIMDGFEATVKIINHYRECQLNFVNSNPAPYIVALSASEIDSNLFT
jgi:CheY-like chemotaxis protein